MSKREILNSLGKSWERDDIFLKIKNGLDTDEIVSEFLFFPISIDLNEGKTSD